MSHLFRLILFGWECEKKEEASLDLESILPELGKKWSVYGGQKKAVLRINTGEGGVEGRE